MEDFSAISTFVRVVEAKSFAAAAAQLGMTPSGVSRAVSRLEAQLGARLLFRSTRSLRLTDDGSAFHARCKEILADLTEATEALELRQPKPTGKLRVGISLSVGRAAVIPRLAEFEQRYPGHPARAVDERLPDGPQRRRARLRDPGGPAGGFQPDRAQDRLSAQRGLRLAGLPARGIGAPQQHRGPEGPPLHQLRLSERAAAPVAVRHARVVRWRWTSTRTC